MDLIIGLGNPGQQYKKTRHNIGFMALDKLAADFKFDKKFNAEIADVTPPTPPVRGGRNVVPPLSGGVGGVGGVEIKLAKPQTFMNLSGQSVQAIMSYYKIKPENLIVIHDDLDIPLGEFKIQKNRSSAGHNGVQSIIDTLGTQDFTRVRIGIKNQKLEYKINAEKFVLEKFNEDELKIIKKIIEEIIKSFN